MDPTPAPDFCGRIREDHPASGSVPALPTVPEAPWPVLDPTGQDSSSGPCSQPRKAFSSHLTAWKWMNIMWQRRGVTLRMSQSSL